jgi:hypothetical protein
MSKKTLNHYKVGQVEKVLEVIREEGLWWLLFNWKGLKRACTAIEKEDWEVEKVERPDVF